MAADAWVVHDKWKEKLHKGDVDTDTDTFECRLYESTSNIATNSLSDASTATDEVSGNGYAADTITVTVSESGGTVTFDCTNPEFTASGGDIVFRWAAIINTSTTPDEVVAHSLIDNTPADSTISDGATGTIEINASGVYGMS